MQTTPTIPSSTAPKSEIQSTTEETPKVVEQTKKQPDEKDVDKFKALLGSKKHVGLDSKEIAQHAEDQPGSQPLTLASNPQVDATLLQQSQTVQVRAEAPVLSPRILPVTTQIVDRIIASTQALDTKQAVVIQFKENVLPGTDVTISKNTGVLEVVFRTTALESAQLLTENKQGLHTHLVDSLHMRSDKVFVSVRGEGATSDGASGEGRSHNRRYVWLEQEEA